MTLDEHQKLRIQIAREGQDRIDAYFASEEYQLHQRQERRREVQAARRRSLAKPFQSYWERKRQEKQQAVTPAHSTDNSSKTE